MAAYKRSDPKKLAKERQEIADSQGAMGRKESLPSLAGRALKKGIGDVIKRVNRRTQRRNGYGSPPQVPGALQHGFKKPDSTA